jgi:hypothetical protein
MEIRVCERMQSLPIVGKNPKYIILIFVLHLIHKLYHAKNVKDL